MAGDRGEEPTEMGGDKLILRGMQFHGFHGVKQEEKKLGQKFVIDVDAWMDLAAAGDSDDIAHTVSYTDIYRCRATPPAPSHSCPATVKNYSSKSALRFSLTESNLYSSKSAFTR
jgi:dihydroneopterin aldolase